MFRRININYCNLKGWNLLRKFILNSKTLKKVSTVIMVGLFQLFANSVAVLQNN